MNPLLQRFRERFDAVHSNVSWWNEKCDCEANDPKEEKTCQKKIEKFILTELSARDARVVEIIEGRKEICKNCSGHLESCETNRVNNALDDLLTALKEETLLKSE